MNEAAQSAECVVIPASTATTTLLEANPYRRNASFYNRSEATLYLKLGEQVSFTSFSVIIKPGMYYEFPFPGYAGRVDGIWDASDGAVYITELI